MTVSWAPALSTGADGETTWSAAEGRDGGGGGVGGGDGGRRHPIEQELPLARRLVLLGLGAVANDIKRRKFYLNSK